MNSMISVVISGYNNLGNVKRLLESLYRQLDFRSDEVIVVDDFSDKCDMSSLKKDFTEVKVIRLKQNMGAAGARNAGAEHASGEIIFFLDADMELCQNTLNEVRKTMSDPKAAACVGTVHHIPLNRGIFQDYWALLKTYFHSLPDSYSSTFYPMVGAIQRDVFDDVGGFDSKIRGASVEDYEFSMRLAEKGYKVLFNPKILVKTGYKDFLTSIKQSFERSKKWGILFLDKRKFDNHTTTLSQGMGNVLGFFIWILLVLSLANPFFFVILCPVSILFLLVNRKFYAYISKKNGPRFMIVCIFIYLASSFFVTIGFINGVFYVFRNKEARRRALYA